jgi:hypothetical protein
VLNSVIVEGSYEDNVESTLVVLSLDKKLDCVTWNGLVIRVVSNGVLVKIDEYKYSVESSVDNDDEKVDVSSDVCCVYLSS